MEDSYNPTQDLKYTLNLVPKVEPNEGEFVLCGEFVDNIPPTSITFAPPKIYEGDPLAEKITGDNPFKLKDFKIVVRDCLQELSTIKTDIKVEDEEQILDNCSEESKPVSESNILYNDEHSNHEITSLSESDHDESYSPKKKFGSHKKKQSNKSKKQPMESVPEMEKFNSSSSNNRKRALWIPQSNSLSLPQAEKKDKVRKKRTMAFLLDEIEPNNILPNKRKRAPSIPQNDSTETGLMPVMKEEDSVEDELTSLSESDHDESYLPKKKSGSHKKKQSNRSKKQPVKSVPEMGKPNNDLSNKQKGALVIPQYTSLLLPRDASKKDTKKESKREEMECVLWSCCNKQFEEFCIFYKHQMEEHQIEGFRCSVCTDKLFSSLDEIERHYFDIHIDSTWKSFHCLNCRLLFGVKSSFDEHKAKCTESQAVSSKILDSIIDFAVGRTEIMDQETDEFKMCCCEKIIRNYNDFVAHKFSEHKIDLLTCGLCLCEKKSKTQLNSHYRKFHFPQYWDNIEFENPPNEEEDAGLTLSSRSQEDVSKELDEDDTAQTRKLKCTAVQDGVLCQCFTCSLELSKLLRPTDVEPNENITVSNCIKACTPFFCKFCNRYFLSKKYLIRHYKTHSGVKPFPCDICGRAFADKHGLKSHKLFKHRTIGSKITKQYLCNICDKAFVTHSTQKKHIYNVHFHLNKNIRLKCKFCEKTFAHSKGLKRHANQFHLKKKEFTCGDCNSVFYDKNVLVEHITRLHLPREKYSCVICGHVYYTKSGLHNHMVCKHSKSELYCEVCGKMINTKQKLIAHMATHSDEKPFVCETCGKRFKRDVNLQQHQYTHSEGRPHQCDICGQTFKLRTHVKQHMAVHGINLNNHKCFVCEKTFSRKAELNSHFSVHAV